MDRDFNDLQKNVENAKAAIEEALSQIDEAISELGRVADHIEDLKNNQKED